MDPDKPDEAPRHSAKREAETSPITGQSTSHPSLPDAHNGLHGLGSSKRPRCGQPLSPAADQLSINPAYCIPEFQNAVCSLLKVFAATNTNLDAAGAEHATLLKNMVFRRPFCHMIFPNFFASDQAVENLEMELLSQKFQNLHKDLFQLTQTKELSTIPDFASLCTTLKTEVRDWVSGISGLTLSDDVDIRGAMYRYTDRLMCHDDKLTTRKVAYVYYMTDAEDWDINDGGTLDLFDSLCVHDVMVPGEIVKRIPPKRNSLVLFLVRDDSFHQVSEIINPKKSRLSVTGWFHAPQAAAAAVEYQVLPVPVPIEFTETSQNNGRICKLAREDDKQAELWKAKCRETFSKQQHLVIQDILDTTFYKALVHELHEKDHIIPWTTPSNRLQAGCYQYYDVRQRSVKDFKYLDFLVKTIMTDQFLQSITDISTVSLEPIVTGAEQVKKMEEALKGNKSTAPGSSGESAAGGEDADSAWFLSTIQFRLERFAHGNYTLKNYDAVQQGAALDLFLFVDCDRLDKDCGGTIVYLDMDTADEDFVPLTKFNGSNNTLQLVRRENSIVFYTDYVNHRWAKRSKGRPFYRLWLSLAAAPDTEETSSSSGSSDGDLDSEEEDDERALHFDEERDAIPPTMSGGSSEDELEE